MNLKTIGSIILLVTILPILGGILVCLSSNNVDCFANLLAQLAIHWWIKPLTFLAGIGGIIGAVLVIGFIWFLKESKSG